ncbi:MAG: hypothetical protein ABUK01_19410, partial [Leptospirales bacterium]
LFVNGEPPCNKKIFRLTPWYFTPRVGKFKEGTNTRALQWNTLIMGNSIAKLLCLVSGRMNIMTMIMKLLSHLLTLNPVNPVNPVKISSLCLYGAGFGPSFCREYYVRHIVILHFLYSVHIVPA